MPLNDNFKNLALLNPFNTASHNILDQNNKYLAALTYLNNKLSQIQHNIDNYPYTEVGTDLVKIFLFL